MNTSAFISALSETIFLSCMQTLVILGFIKFLFKVISSLSANTKYWILYSSLTLSFGLFVLSLASLYYSKTDIISNSVNISYSVSSNSKSLLENLLLWQQQNARLIAVLYFVGMAFQISRFTSGWLDILQIKRNEILFEDEDWLKRVKRLREKAKVFKEITLYVSRNIAVPFTVGFLKPAIIVPVAMLNRLSVGQVEAILLHELAHIKRNDYLFNIFQRLMETALFFNPCVWLISKEIERQREYCCDESVLINTEDAVSYAKALLILEENRNDNVFAMAAKGADKYPLLTRIKRLTIMNKLKTSPTHGFIALAAIVSVGISLAWAIPTLKEKKTLAFPQQDTVKTIENTVKAIQVNRTDTTHKVVKKDSKTIETDKDNRIVVQDTSNAFYNSKEWKDLQKEIQKNAEAMKKVAEEQKKFFASDEWKKQQQEIQKNAVAMKKHFDSQEWKQLQSEIQKNAEEMRKFYDNPEWKKMQAEFQQKAQEWSKKALNTDEWKKHQKEFSLKAEEFQKKFNNPEWQKKQLEFQKKAEEFQKKFDSEWQKKQTELDKKSQELAEKWKNSDFEKKMETLGEKQEELMKKMESEKTESAEQK
ncbi:M56 family metallopeptidase [Rubrolithibacter danxiaensis]|uniref:M56 family metallopeptidase n=1 Tax=Rubrolithibacter danxiaensis TaxID=3390805 RepID=UPI003BF91373